MELIQQCYSYLFWGVLVALALLRGWQCWSTFCKAL